MRRLATKGTPTMTAREALEQVRGEIEKAREMAVNVAALEHALDEASRTRHSYHLGRQSGMRNAIAIIDAALPKLDEEEDDGA